MQLRAKGQGVGGKESVLSFVREHAGYCDDCVAAQLGIQPRQTVNIQARALSAVGSIIRVPGVCEHCRNQKIVNTHPSAVSAQPKDASECSGAGGAPVTNRRRSVVILDGAASLRRLLECAGYQSVAHAVAEHTVFLHPDTVAQTRGEAVFPVIRSPLNTPRARVVELPDGRRVWADDNGPPTSAFLWRLLDGRGLTCNSTTFGREATRRDCTQRCGICVRPPRSLPRQRTRGQK